MAQKGMLFKFFAVCIVSYAPLHGSEVISFSDPAPMFSVYGQGRPGLPTKKSQLSLSVMPYYQYARHARDVQNTQTALGNRLGNLNMLGLLLNDVPTSLAHRLSALTSDTALNTAYTELNTAINAATDPTRYEVFFGATYQPLEVADSRVNWGKYDTGTNAPVMSFSRVGARGSLDYCFYNGVGITVRGGVAEYSVKNPVYTGNPVYDITTGLPTNAALSSTDAVLLTIQQYLTGTGARNALGTVLGINFNGVKNTGIEDTTVEISWRRGFAMKDAEGDHVVTATPLVVLSMTLPTAEKKPVENLWDISLGSDGFYGMTGQAEMSFDFPGMLNAAAGVSGTYFNEDAIGAQFAPTSIYQAGIYPWKATVTKRPGALWKAYGSVRATRFVDSLSCYVTYMYVAHEKDTITFSGTNSAEFKADKLAQDGSYSAQIAHIGFEYEVTPSLRFGFALQSIFAGKQVWKTTTFAGSVSFVF